MSITIVGEVAEHQTTFILSAPIEANGGDLFGLGTEIVAFVSYWRDPLIPARRATHDRVRVRRGMEGTTRAIHADGTALRGALDAFLRGADETPPSDPFTAGGGGSGLPSQWTDGGNGDVIATVDDPTKTPLTVQGIDQGTNDPFTVRVGNQRAAKTFTGSANGSLVYTAVTDGAAGNAIRVEHFDMRGIPDSPLSVVVVGSDITVNLATDVTGDNLISTAAQVKAAIEASGPASALITAAFAPANDGTGLVGTGIVDTVGGLDAADALVVSKIGFVNLGALALLPAPGSEHAILVDLVPAFFDDSDDILSIRIDGEDYAVLDDNGFDLFARADGNGEQGTYLRLSGDPRKAFFTSNRIELTDPALGIADAGTYFKVTEEASVRVGINTAPADDELNPGQVSLWFDPTNGAAKLQLKGKTLDGTVVTGSVNLT